jgi:hypothetical protein
MDNFFGNAMDIASLCNNEDRFLLIGTTAEHEPILHYLTAVQHCTEVCAHGDTALQMAELFDPDIIIVSLADLREAEATLNGLQDLPLGDMYTVIGLGTCPPSLERKFDVVLPSADNYGTLLSALKRFEAEWTIEPPPQLEGPRAHASKPKLQRWGHLL